jgi:ankyrin repeat protein
LVRVLVELKADIIARSTSGQTPLHLLSEGNPPNGPKVARYLLEHGADVNARSDGGTPLHRTLRHDGVEIARVLIEHGADIDAEDDDGCTPLRTASKSRADKVAKLLLEHGAKPSGVTVPVPSPSTSSNEAAL